MKQLESNSCFSIVCDFTLSLNDEKVLSLLYLPIIKADSYSLYYSLLYRVDLIENNGYFYHDDFLNELGYSSSSFLKARERLEAIGLIEVYRKEKDNNVLYLYKILPPATGKKFFNDLILKNLLNQNIGKKRFNYLSSYFSSSNNINQEFNDVTANFRDVFTLNLDSQEPVLNEDDLIYKDKSYKKAISFNSEELKDLLNSENVPFSSVKNDFAEIVNQAILYSLTPVQTKDLIILSLDSDNTFYLKKFLDEARKINKYIKETDIEKEKTKLGKGNSSKRIDVFESCTPQKYLQIYFKAEPSKYMLYEVEKIRKDFHFSNGVINVILDYSLRRTNGEFSITYIEKVCFSLSKAEVKDTYDAMVYLTNREYELKNRNKANNTTVKVQEPKKETEEELSDEEIDLLKEGLVL